MQTRSAAGSDVAAVLSTPVGQKQGTAITEMVKTPTQAMGQQAPTTYNLDFISSDIAHLSEEGKVIVNTIVKALCILSKEKDEKIEKLPDRVNSLEDTVSKLENQLDDVEQYERRDTIIISGPVLPKEQNHENPTDLVVKAIKDNLHINLNHADINVAHRLGSKTQNKERPVIVKLLNRSKKSEIMEACVKVKPSLYVNESLTPKRRNIFNTVWATRK